MEKKYRYRGLSKLQIGLIIITAIVVLAIAGGVFAYFYFGSEEEVKETTAPTFATQTPATADEPATEPPTEDPDAQYEVLADEYLGTMSIDEKIYQMLLPTPEAITGVDGVTMAGDTTKSAIEKYPVGGLIYSEINLEDDKQTTEMIEKSQSYAKTPMFIAITEEGGDNSPISEKLDTTKRFESSVYTKNSDEVQTYSSAIAQNISKYGFNLNLAPSANIEGDNAFAGDVKGDAVRSAFNGFNSNGVIAAIKYFPVQSDSSKTLDELRASELPPFAATIDSGAEIIMISSAKVPAIDADTPAFMSQRIVTEVLIKELKFDGVVITPDLSDSAIKDKYKANDIALNALHAGADILLKPADIDSYFDAIKKAVDSGEISQTQIDNSVKKILALKFKYGILDASKFSTSQTGGADVATATQVTVQ